MPKLYDAGHKADVFVRSHRHYCVYMDIGHTRYLVTPCWMFWNEFQQMSGMGGTYPTIGAVAFTVETNGNIIFEKYILPDKTHPKMVIHKVDW
jgi:hypothetical protein